MAHIRVFDTTLRDGEQSPGATMTSPEKLRMAKALASLGVDVIEAGFPAASPQDLEAVRTIAREVRGPIITALARAHDEDIDHAAEAVEDAEKKRIHTFLATSEIHLTHKLRISQEECLDRIGRAVERARSYVDDVEFSPEDGTRTELDFLCQAVQVAIDAGATTVNIPDTVGYALPRDFQEIFRAIYDRVDGAEDVIFSVHCHDDLGLAVANSLAGIGAGARQVECTINGIGERAGNASLEEIVMALRVRPDLGDFETRINTERIYPTSELLTHLTGLRPQPNKAIVGANAFAHEAGIHQDGMLKERMTYEIMTPQMVGAPDTKLVLGKHSGRHALKKRYEEMGLELEPGQLDRAYRLFVMLADQKKNILDEDLLAIYYDGSMEDVPRVHHLEFLEVVCGMSPSKAHVKFRKDDGPVKEARGEGDGPVAAAVAAIDKITPEDTTLESMDIHAATPGRDAVGEVHVRVNVGDNVFTGRAASTDVVDGVVRAVLNALDKAEYARTLEEQAEERSFERAPRSGV
ncbi:MAG: 2-isopropylmalate synthase [Longimicrobiales bacterium]|nr:2-isopropylmalate synthase [Longimicrobiales bacterium]